MNVFVTEEYRNFVPWTDRRLSGFRKFSHRWKFNFWTDPKLRYGRLNKILFSPFVSGVVDSSSISHCSPDILPYGTTDYPLLAQETRPHSGPSLPTKYAPPSLEGQAVGTTTTRHTLRTEPSLTGKQSHRRLGHCSLNYPITAEISPFKIQGYKI